MVKNKTLLNISNFNKTSFPWITNIAVHFCFTGHAMLGLRGAVS